MHKDFLRDLAFFLLGLGKQLKQVLRNPNAFASDPKFGLWLESAKKLGIIREEEGRLVVDWDAIENIKIKLREVLEDWISESG